MDGGDLGAGNECSLGAGNECVLGSVFGAPWDIPYQYLIRRQLMKLVSGEIVVF